MDTDTQQQDWIHEVRAEIDKSGFDLDHRAALHRTLNDAGKLLNGHPDKLPVLFSLTAEKAIRDIRNEIILRSERKKEIDAGIAAHIESCSFARRSGLKGLADRLSDQYPVLIVVLLVAASKSEFVMTLIKDYLTK